MSDKLKKILVALSFAALVGVIFYSFLTRPAGAITPQCPLGLQKTLTYDFITYDNGMNGLWAVDNFHSKLEFYRLGCGEWEIVRTDEGTFEALDALSPGGDGVTTISDDVVGTIKGGITVRVHGMLKPNLPDEVGVDDLREVEADYFNKYFGRFFVKGVSQGSVESWGWTYSTCFNGTWVDNPETEAIYGEVGVNEAMGDISGDYIPCEQEPEPTPTPETPKSEPSAPSAPVCPDNSPILVPQNPHVVRNGSEAVVNAFIPEGNQVNIYFKENGQDSWQHAAADIPVVGGFVSYTIKDLNPALGYTFGIQAANSCAGGETIVAVIIDPPANGKIFHLSFWEWLR